MAGVLPNFFIPGAAKAGTSTLYDYLARHPDIYMGKGKEPGYFSYRWEMGLEWYKSRFDTHAGQKMIGEATPSYMAHPDAARRIKELIPGAKFIFCLRDPVARAQSHYWHRVKRLIEKRTLDEVLRAGAAEYPIEFGLYNAQICRFLDLFPREQLHFNILELMNKSPQESVQAIFRFLGVDADVAVEDLRTRNKGYLVRNLTVARALEDAKSQSGFKRFVPKPLRPLGRKVYELLRRRNIKSFDVPPLTREQRLRLEETFLPEIKALEKTLNIDLSLWYGNYLSLAVADGRNVDHAATDIAPQIERAQ